MQCQRRGCEHPATHGLKLACPRLGQPDEAMHLAILMGLELCEDHADEADANAFLKANPDLRSMFAVAAAGGPPLDFDRVYAVGVSIADPDYLALKALQNRKPN